QRTVLVLRVFGECEVTSGGVIRGVAIESYPPGHLLGKQLATNVDFDGWRNRGGSVLAYCEQHPVAGSEDIAVLRQMNNQFVIRVNHERQFDLACRHVQGMGN